MTDMTDTKWFVQVEDTEYPDIKMYNILEPNPDAGKVGGSYSGKYLMVTTLDSEEYARFIVQACNNYGTLLGALEGILLVALPCDGAQFEFEKTYRGMFRVLGNRLERAVEVIAQAKKK